jgi:hypothetical protein
VTNVLTNGIRLFDDAQCLLGAELDGHLDLRPLTLVGLGLQNLKNVVVVDLKYLGRIRHTHAIAFAFQQVNFDSHVSIFTVLGGRCSNPACRFG